MKTQKKSWIQSLFAYAEGEKKKMLLSVVLSVVSVTVGLAPFYCMYRIICLFVEGGADTAGIIGWCLWALLAYGVKIVTFTLSTGVSHSMAYRVLEGLRLRLADRFLHAPLGDVENHTIGEIKSMMVDKIENLEPPLAHMIPEGAGHVVLPIVSIAALLCIDWRLALASLVTFPLSVVCMMLTMVISGKNFQTYDQSNAYMNSIIVEYMEGIEVIKAFGRAGVSYEKYAKAITDFRTFVVKWLSSTYLTMKLSFALFPSTLIGTLPVALALTAQGHNTAPTAALAVMLFISMVGSLAKLEVFSENMRQVEFTVKGLQKFLEMPELPEPKERAEVPSTGVELKEVHFFLHRQGGGRGAARRESQPAAGQLYRAGRAVRRRKIHRGQADRPLLGRFFRQRGNRRRERPGYAAQSTQRIGQFCDAGQLSVPLLPDGEYPAGQSQGDG